MSIGLHAIALRLCDLGIEERPGPADHPFILWSLERAGIPADQAHDETPWCGAALGVLCDLLGLESPALRAHARNWLKVGEPVALEESQPGDIVVFGRGINSPPADVLDAPGHVAILDLRTDLRVYVVGGNQGDRFSRAAFPVSQVLGVRRV